MALILGIAYIAIIILTMLSLAKDGRNSQRNKNIKFNPKDKKIALLIVLGIMFFYYIIGYIFKTDILNAITLRRNGVSFSFLGMILLIATSLLVVYIIEVIRKHRR